MALSEKKTREQHIDPKLRELNWTVIPHKKDLDISSLTAHAVGEYPTESGPVDYAFFVDGKLLAMMEVKKLNTPLDGILTQAKRYSRGVPNTIGYWGDYHVPFLYSANGTEIKGLDVSDKKDIAKIVPHYPSPRGLALRFEPVKPDAALWFKKNPVHTIEKLYDFQAGAVESIEKAIRDGKRNMYVAMATGTGKTFTTVSLIYRLLKSKYAKRILFLVDRRALAAQAVSEMSRFETPGRRKLDQEYNVYSQKFQRDDLEDNVTYNSTVLLNEYLTNPGENHTFIYVSTIQRMVGNLWGKEAMGDFEYEGDIQQLDISPDVFDVIIADECHRGYSANLNGIWKRTLEYFDALKIGLTATPALHTTAMFQHCAFRYTTEQAVEAGFLVDYDAVKIKSDILVNGAFLKEGEKVGTVDTKSGKELLELLEDEREFASTEIEKKITVPDCTTKVIKALKFYTDAHEKQYGRFPKTLIFAVNDLPHHSHADQVVQVCKQVFDQGDDFALKITGRNVDRPLQLIKRFRNRKEPKIVVTVDMLSTGVDIKPIEFVVFMRIVKSRILWVQMVGRGTRTCTGINKEKFTVVDCFDGTLINYFKDSTDMDICFQAAEPLSIVEVIERIYDNIDREYNVKRLIRRLRRIEKGMGAKAREQFARFIDDGDMKAYADTIAANLDADFTGTMKLLLDTDFQHLLVNYIKPGKVFLKAYEAVDTVEHEVMFPVSGGLQKPEDYLESFFTYVRDNPDHIEGIEILLSRPKGWNARALDDLRIKLDKSTFPVADLKRAHGFVYKKPTADIISMIKHAANLDAPILSAGERVNNALNFIKVNEEYTPEQLQWLDYIGKHMIKNLSICRDDFDDALSYYGGFGKAGKVFGSGLNGLLDKLNRFIAV